MKTTLIIGVQISHNSDNQTVYLISEICGTFGIPWPIVLHVYQLYQIGGMKLLLPWVNTNYMFVMSINRNIW